MFVAAELHRMVKGHSHKNRIPVPRPLKVTPNKVTGTLPGLAFSISTESAVDEGFLSQDKLGDIVSGLKSDAFKSGDDIPEDPTCPDQRWTKPVGSRIENFVVNDPTKLFVPTKPVKLAAASASSSASFKSAMSEAVDNIDTPIPGSSGTNPLSAEELMQSLSTGPPDDKQTEAEMNEMGITQVYKEGGSLNIYATLYGEGEEIPDMSEGTCCAAMVSGFNYLLAESRKIERGRLMSTEIAGGALLGVVHVEPPIKDPTSPYYEVSVDKKKVQKAAILHNAGTMCRPATTSSSLDMLSDRLDVRHKLTPHTATHWPKKDAVEKTPEEPGRPYPELTDPKDLLRVIEITLPQRTNKPAYVLTYSYARHKIMADSDKSLIEKIKGILGLEGVYRKYYYLCDYTQATLSIK